MKELLIIIGLYFFYIIFKNINDSGVWDISDLWNSPKEDIETLIDVIVKPKTTNNPPDSSPEPIKLERDTQIHPDLDALDDKLYTIFERFLDDGFDYKLCNALNEMDKSLSYRSEYNYYDPIEAKNYQLFLQKKKQYFKSKKWKEIRNSILERDNYSCALCNSSSEDITIDVHHKRYGNLFNEKMDDLVALCRQCHDDLHKASGYPSKDIELLDIDYFWSENLDRMSERPGRRRPRGKSLFLS